MRYYQSSMTIKEWEDRVWDLENAISLYAQMVYDPKSKLYCDITMQRVLKEYRTELDELKRKHKEQELIGQEFYI